MYLTGAQRSPHCRSAAMHRGAGSDRARALEDTEAAGSLGGGSCEKAVRMCLCLYAWRTSGPPHWNPSSLSAWAAHSTARTGLTRAFHPPLTTSGARLLPGELSNRPACPPGRAARPEQVVSVRLDTP